MAFAGQKTRKAVRISTGLFFILLTTLSFTFALPISPVQTSHRPDLNGGPAQPGSIGSRTWPPLNCSKSVLEQLHNHWHQQDRDVRWAEYGSQKRSLFRTFVDLLQGPFRSTSQVGRGIQA